MKSIVDKLVSRIDAIEQNGSTSGGNQGGLDEDAVKQLIEQTVDTTKFATKDELSGYASYSHGHTSGDITDKISEYNETNKIFEVDGDIFSFNTNPIIIQLKTVPSSEWSMKLKFSIYTNDFENDNSEFEVLIKSTESFNKSDEIFGYSIVGGSGCVEGMKITFSQPSFLCEIRILELSGFSKTIDEISHKINKIQLGVLLNDHLIYGSAVKQFIGKVVIPTIKALEDRVKELEDASSA